MGIQLQHTRGAVGDAADQLRGSAGTLSVAEPCEATGEKPMSDDPDFQKANYAWQVLRQARFSRNEKAARMVEHLAFVTGQHRVADARNRGDSASRMGCNYRVGECSQRRVCRAHSLEGRVWSDGNLDRTTRLAVFAASGLPFGNNHERRRCGTSTAPALAIVGD